MPPDLNTVSIQNPTKNLAEREIMSQVTMRNGYWFFFNDEGNDISVHGSAWSGKETVYFNNKKVSELRNITRLSAQHSFEKNDNAYRVKVTLKSVMKGGVEVVLYKNEQLIGQETQSYLENKSAFKKLFPFILTGAIFGASIFYFTLKFLG